MRRAQSEMVSVGKAVTAVCTAMSFTSREGALIGCPGKLEYGFRLGSRVVRFLTGVKEAPAGSGWRRGQVRGGCCAGVLSGIMLTAGFCKSVIDFFRGGIT
jgi:hypothetical protein